MNRPVTSKDLPEWFSENIRKYNKYEDLTDLEWYEQLAARKIMYDYGYRNSETSKYFIELLIENPIIDTGKTERSKFLFRDTLGTALLDQRGPLYKLSGVSQASVRDVFALTRSIDQSKQKHINGFLDLTGIIDIERMKKSPYHFEKWINDPIDFHKADQKDSVTLSVDLNLPDNILIEQFQTQIKEYRRQIGQNPKDIKNQRKFLPKNFVKVGLMPFLDLYMWEMISGDRFDDSVYAYATSTLTFNSEKNLEHKIYELRDSENLETTKRIAYEVMTEEFMRLLAAKVAHTNKIYENYS